METTGSIFNEAQVKELANLKAHFPFRIIWGAFNPQTMEFEAHADFNRRKLMKRVRTPGWICATIS